MFARVLILSLALLSVFSTYAKSDVDEQKAVEVAKNDSIDSVKAKNALQTNTFAFLCDKIEAEGQFFYVSENMNYFTTNGDRAMLQISPMDAYFDGINLKGSVSSSSIRTDKKGNTIARYTLCGRLLNATLTLTLFKDSNIAQAFINPDFTSGSFTMFGSIVELGSLPIFESTLHF